MSRRSILASRFFERRWRRGEKKRTEERQKNKEGEGGTENAQQPEQTGPRLNARRGELGIELHNSRKTCAPNCYRSKKGKKRKGKGGTKREEVGHRKPDRLVTMAIRLRSSGPPPSHASQYHALIHLARRRSGRWNKEKKEKNRDEGKKGQVTPKSSHAFSTGGFCLAAAPLTPSCQ